jgi:glycosyltransferase involved in cell wall biosynthesis
MKILLISYTADVHHGWGNITHEYCKALQKKGIAFTLLLPENEPHRETIDYPCEYVLPPYTTTLRHRFLWKYLSYRLPPRFQGYTLIHNLFDFPYCYLAYRLSQQLRLRYITGSQGTYGVLPLFRWLDCSLQKKSYNHAYKIITPSRYTALLIEKFSQTPTPFQVIHNGVHWERFASPVPPEKIQAIRNQYPGQFLVLGVGGLKKRKGFHIVLKALTFLREKPIKYLIIGKGIMEKELRELVAQEKLENQVEFLGQRGGEDLVSYFQACDLYCHTPINEDFHF